MKSKYLVTLIGLGLASTIATACGDDSDNDGKGGAGTTGSTASSSTHSVTSPSSTGASMGDDGNSSFATAADLTAGTAATADLADSGMTPATDEDYFKFDGTAGPWYLAVTARPEGDETADGYIDTYMTVYDANMQQIALNDDRFPDSTRDSEVLTILPADGTYYLKVEDWCHSSDKDARICNDDYFAAILSTQYSVFATPVTTDVADIPEVEPNDTSVTGTVLTHKPNGAGKYFLTTTWGTFSSGTDADWFKIDVPADVNTDATVETVTQIVIPWGSDTGNGSNVDVGVVEIHDATDALIGKYDFSDASKASFDRVTMDVPLSPATTYFLKFQKGPDLQSGSGSFYFGFQGVYAGNALETGEPTNDLPATPAALVKAPTQDSYFVSGTLGTGDLADHFSVDTLGHNGMNVACGAIRSGSLLTGLKAEVLTEAGVATGLSATDGADADLLLSDGMDPAGPVAVPGGAAKVIVKLTGTPGAAAAGSWYRCGIHFSDM